jgi:hypothetical protein
MSDETQGYKKVTLSPPVKREQGRPPFKPTDQQREQVKAMSSHGVPHRQQAPLIGCSSPKRLRKHFREELNIGKIQANAKVDGALYQSALDGNVKAQTFWLKTVDGWQETGNVEIVSEGELGAIKRASEVARILFGRFGEERVDI